MRNDTGHQFDTDLLTKKIRVKLNTSGKALTTTTMGVGGKAEDPLAKGLQSEREFLEDKKVTRVPDFSLSGKILENRASAGNVKQSTFSFQLYSPTTVASRCGKVKRKSPSKARARRSGFDVSRRGVAAFRVSFAPPE